MVATEDTIAESLRGVAVGLLTPFDGDGAIDYEALGANASALSDEGIETFLAPANISEYHALTDEERERFARTAVDALPDDACVLAGTGGNLPQATALAAGYERAGVDGLMIMPPDHTYVHEEGLLSYHRELATATDLPLVPYVKGFEPSVDFLASLTRLDSVVGVKYAIEDPVKLGSAVAAGSDDVVWIDGLAEPYAVSFWAEGVEGFSAGVSNFRPAVGLALYDALEAGEWDRARQLRDICLPFQQLRDETGEDNAIPGALSVPTVKKGLDLAGLTGGDVRAPIRPLTPGEEQRIEAVYDRLDDDIDRLV